MAGFSELFQALMRLVVTLKNVGDALLLLFASGWMFIVWVVFWILLVRWPDLNKHLRKGAWIAGGLLVFLVCLVWGLLSNKAITIEGYTFSPVAVQFVWGIFAVSLAFLCGKIQSQNNAAPPEIEIAGPPEDAGGSAGHGHGTHGGHSHGHDAHAPASHTGHGHAAAGHHGHH